MKTSKSKVASISIAAFFICDNGETSYSKRIVNTNVAANGYINDVAKDKNYKYYILYNTKGGLLRDQEGHMISGKTEPITVLQ